MELLKSMLDIYIPKNHPLMVINREIDFGFVHGICKQHYASSGEGRPPIDPEVLFRICFVSFFENMSFREVVCRLEHDLLLREFCNWWKPGHPNHSTLSVFLDRVGPGTISDAFNHVVEQAREKGIITDRLSAIDSTIVESHANHYRLWVEGGSPDPDAKWTKKRGESYYGFKAHTACDVDSRMSTTLKSTPANQSDMTFLAPVVDPNADASTADKGYSSEKNRKLLTETFKQEDVIIPKNNENIHIDREKAKGRTQVERNYSIVKRCHRLNVTISWGLDRFKIQAGFAFMAWNAKCWVQWLFKQPCYKLKAKCA